MSHHPGEMTRKVPPPPVWQYRAVLVVHVVLSLSRHRVISEMQVFTTPNVPTWQTLLVPGVLPRTRLERKFNTAWISQSRNHRLLKQYLNIMPGSTQLVCCCRRIEAARPFKIEDEIFPVGLEIGQALTSIPDGKLLTSLLNSWKPGA